MMEDQAIVMTSILIWEQLSTNVENLQGVIHTTVPLLCAPGKLITNCITRVYDY